MNWLRWSYAHMEWSRPKLKEWHWTRWVALASLAAAMALGFATWAGLAPDEALVLKPRAASRILLDRQGHVLAEDIGEWNVQDQIPLYRVPLPLQQAVLTAEDRRFYTHRGVDWMARIHAVWQGLRAGRNVRGASTITEQTVRMLVPRPRTLWSKWLEGFDARRLEMRATKADILEFYLNQVPYAANRRGVVEAARYYFNRDLDTLDAREMLTLAVLPRAPSGLDPYRGGGKILDRRSIRLAMDMHRDGFMSGEDVARLVETPLDLQPPPRRSAIGHFRSYVERQLAQTPVDGRAPRVVTTLDSGLMDFAQGLLDQRLASLAGRRVNNGAILIADHRTGEILAWVVAGADVDADRPGRYLDAVLVPRQPGSALKPFLYAAAFDAGWSPGVLVQDAPLSEAVGTGLHRFNNYSHQFYGEVTVRQALGNSLNIPAIHAVEFVGPDRYLSVLHRLGFDSLKRPAGFYGDGLALGNGEVSLLELVRGYAGLAEGGRFTPLRAVAAHDKRGPDGAQVLSRDATMLIGNILSDPWARSMEFGRYSTLNLPVQTAVKTGTSTDYRDAWAVGFDSRYVVGIWMGNLDQSPTDGLTGSTGPGLVLRGLFAYLDRDRNTRRLPMSSDLAFRDNCDFTSGACAQIYDYRSNASLAKPEAVDVPGPAILSPTPDLRLAYDPRLPADRQMYRFALAGVEPDDHVTWLVNGKRVAAKKGDSLMWKVQRGAYTVEALLETEDGETHLGPVAFTVR
ncbi:MAG TPA: transglycosylase domain-containing protein [Parvibaculum sp.]